ncbi:major surface glycoprotein G [Striga asiatica]|uniref:Major surface glycoprotein G n=1 Tax=Striga asiatica TaxID=4170 RepID=A0A5A7QZX1_STRAF|nr:major surface glycoprotein G [Striga asiatica]
MIPRNESPGTRTDAAFLWVRPKFGAIAAERESGCDSVRVLCIVRLEISMKGNASVFDVQLVRRHLRGSLQRGYKLARTVEKLSLSPFWVKKGVMNGTKLDWKIGASVRSGFSNSQPMISGVNVLHLRSRSVEHVLESSRGQTFIHPKNAFVVRNLESHSAHKPPEATAHGHEPPLKHRHRVSPSLPICYCVRCW